MIAGVMLEACGLHDATLVRRAGIGRRGAPGRRASSIAMCAIHVWLRGVSIPRQSRVL